MNKEWRKGQYHRGTRWYKIPPIPLYEGGKLLLDSRLRGNDNWARE